MFFRSEGKQNKTGGAIDGFKNVLKFKNTFESITICNQKKTNTKEMKF